MLKVKKIKPMFTALITTMNKYAVDETINGIIDSNRQKGALKEYQTVLAVGSAVRDVKVGDVVLVNPAAYAVRKFKDKENSIRKDILEQEPVIGYNFNVVEVDGKNCLLLQERDIEYVIEEYEEVTESDSGIIYPDTSIII